MTFLTIVHLLVLAKKARPHLRKLLLPPLIALRSDHAKRGVAANALPAIRINGIHAMQNQSSINPG